MNTASLNLTTLISALDELAEATADLQFAISRIEAANGSTLSEPTKAARLKTACDLRDDAAKRCENVSAMLRNLAAAK